MIKALDNLLFFTTNNLVTVSLLEHLMYFSSFSNHGHWVQIAAIIMIWGPGINLKFILRIKQNQFQFTNTKSVSHETAESSYSVINSETELSMYYWLFVFG